MTPYPKQALREHDPRPDLVRLVQTRLNELGHELVVDGDFRGATRSAVRVFQTRSGLEPDGIVGPVTWAILFDNPPLLPQKPPSALAGAVLEVAESQVGIRETGGSNRGKEVETYLASVGLLPGKAYCAAFVYWCFAEGSMRLGIKNPAVKTGKVISHWLLAPIATKITAEATRDNLMLIRPGSLFLIDHGNDRGHMGFVTSLKQTGLSTIEGNTDASGSREGQGVYARTRRFGEINLGYLDYSRT